MLDFLKELVEGIPDPSAGGTIPLDVPSESEPASSSRRKGKKAAVSATDGADDDGGRVAPAKRRRRKKKEEAPEVDNSAVNGEGDETMQDVAPPNRGDENWDVDDESGGYR
jgi:Dr1-associated corepressor